MNRIRLAKADVQTAGLACSRCGRTGGRWDRIADKPYCPQCEEALALGEAEPLVEKTARNRCAICDSLGTLRFVSFPLQSSGMVEIDLCSQHVRGLIGRHLGPFAFHQLRRQLDGVSIDVNDIFLLHEAFYDYQGRALRPLNDLDLAG